MAVDFKSLLKSSPKTVPAAFVSEPLNVLDIPASYCPELPETPAPATKPYKMDFKALLKAKEVATPPVVTPPPAIPAVEPKDKGLSFAERIALRQKLLKEAKLLAEPTPEDKKLAPEPFTPAEVIKLEPKPKSSETFSLSIKLNAQQMLGVEYARAGKSFVLTGPAGTGKTTACREIARELLHSGSLGKHDFADGTAPSIAFCAYTRLAAQNMAKAILKDPELREVLPHNVLTIHKLLEYKPEFFTTPDGKDSMRFVPTRHAQNPLQITHLVVEEASMVDAFELYSKLFDALLPGVQIVFVGDINQLPPVFGPSILNYALTALPVVELTEVYRQALESPVLANAHQVLKGLPLIPHPEYFKIYQSPASAKAPSVHKNAILLANQLKKLYANGKAYDPAKDIVLTPFNKHELGSDNINAHIAQFIGDKNGAEVYEVLAGRRKLYLAIGDRVYFNKRIGTVTKINPNGLYIGKAPKPNSRNLSRWGAYIGNQDSTEEDFTLEGDYTGYENVDVDKIDDDEDKKEKERQASHVVSIVMDDDEDIETVLSKVGEFSDQNFSLGYALTVHKSQGQEWRKVFIVLHRQHAVMLYRELLYTAITRASQYVILIDLCNVVSKAITNPRLVGNTVAEKIMSFNAKLSMEIPVPIIP